MIRLVSCYNHHQYVAVLEEACRAWAANEVETASALAVGYMRKDRRDLLTGHSGPGMALTVLELVG